MIFKLDSNFLKLNLIFFKLNSINLKWNFTLFKLMYKCFKWNNQFFQLSCIFFKLYENWCRFMTFREILMASGRGDRG